MLNVFLLTIILLIIVSFFLFNSRKNKERSSTSDANSTVNQVTSNLQEKPENISLTKEEKAELSWKFLTDLTNSVVQKFSGEDQGKLTGSGQRMNQFNMNYQHSVDREATVIIKHAQKGEK